MPQVVYQPVFKFEEDVPLDRSVVLLGDSRWDYCISEFEACSLFSLDLETYGAEEHKKEDLEPDALNAWRGQIRLIQIGLTNGLSIVVDLGGWDADRKAIQEHLESIGFFSLLKRKLACLKTRVVNQNIKFDLLYLKAKYGFDARNVCDTEVLSRILWAGIGVKKMAAGGNNSDRCDLPHDLKGICDRLGLAVDKTEQTSNWGWELTNKQLNYAGKDTQAALYAYQKLYLMIKEEGLVYSAWAESLAIPVFVDIQYYGMPIDTVLLDEMIEKYERIQEILIQPFRKSFPDVLPSSPKQVEEALRQKYGIDLEKTNKEALALLPYPETKSLLAYRSLLISTTYLKNSIKEKMFDGYLRTKFRQIGPSGQGRSTSGDTKNGYPNLQNVPRPTSDHKRSYPLRFMSVEAMGYQFELPEVEIPVVEKIVVKELGNPKKEYSFPVTLADLNLENSVLKLITAEAIDTATAELVLWDLPSVRDVFKSQPHRIMVLKDLSASHDRISTEASQDPTAIDIFCNNRDSHSITAATIAAQQGLNWTADEISKWRKEDGHPNQFKAEELRNQGKTGNYSQLNQAGAARMLQEAKKNALEITEDDCKGIKKGWRETFRVRYNYIQSQYQRSNDYNYRFDHFKDKFGKPITEDYGSIRGLTGRKIYFKKLPSDFHNGRLMTPLPEVTAAQWLSAEADIIKAAMGLILLELDKHPEWNAFYTSFGHDDCIIECDREYGLEVAQVVQKYFHQELKRFIKSIPVDDAKSIPEKLLCEAWADK